MQQQQQQRNFNANHINCLPSRTAGWFAGRVSRETWCRKRVAPKPDKAELHATQIIHAVTVMSKQWRI